MNKLVLGASVLVFDGSRPGVGDRAGVAAVVTGIEPGELPRISVTMYAPGAAPRPLTGIQHRSAEKVRAPAAIENPSGNQALDAARRLAAEISYRPWDGFEHPSAYLIGVHEAHRVYLQGNPPQRFWDWPDSNDGTQESVA